MYFSAAETDRLAIIIVPRQSARRCCEIFLPSRSSASAFLISTTSAVPGDCRFVGAVNFWKGEAVSRGRGWGRHSCFICSSSWKQMHSPQVLPLLHYISLHLRRPRFLWIFACDPLLPLRALCLCCEAALLHSSLFNRQILQRGWNDSCFQSRESKINNWHWFLK